jgi:hypothetical protein
MAVVVVDGGPVVGLAFSHTGQALAASSARRVVVWGQVQ